ncbi:hypothetical protein V8D89_005221 [Ganoderma adspersum]
MSDSELPEYLKIPEALRAHPELVKRDLVLDYPLNIGSVYATSGLNRPQFVIKLLNPATEEAAIVDRLQHDTSTRNHLVPCEIIRSDRTLLVMPYVPRVDQPIRREKDPLKRLRVLLKVFHQIAEGVEHLHSLRIAHIDLCYCNVMVALKDTEEKYPQTKAGRVYIIDFDRSRQLALGPGRQPAIELPSTQYQHPLQMTSFDPYSWDVYCMGMLFQRLTNDWQSSPPWLLTRLCQWVIGNERGCSGVCHCRPSARRVLVVFTVIGWVVSLSEALGKSVAAVRALFVSFRSPTLARG